MKIANGNKNLHGALGDSQEGRTLIDNSSSRTEEVNPGEKMIKWIKKKIDIVKTLKNEST